MEKILTHYVVCTLAVALMVPLAQAQPAGIQAASFGHTEYGGKARAHHRSGKIAGSSESFLRQSAKSDHGTLRQ
jgi:hypothetical protein